MRKLVVGIALLIVAFGGCSRRDEYFEDIVSHSVKRRSGLFGKETLVFQSPSFDSRSAQWQSGVTLAARNTVADGDTFLVKAASTIYLVNVANQQCRPDRLRYLWRRVDETEEHLGEGAIITLPFVKIHWSCAVPGSGHIYAAPFFLQQPPEYQIGIPFLQKPLNTITPADVESVRYTSYPWEI